MRASDEEHVSKAAVTATSSADSRPPVVARVHLLELLVFGLCLPFPIYAWFASVVHREDNNYPFVATFVITAVVHSLIQCAVAGIVRRDRDRGIFDPSAWGSAFWYAVLFGPVLAVIVGVISPDVTDWGILGRAGEGKWSVIFPWALGGALLTFLLVLIGLIVFFPLGYLVMGLIPRSAFENLRRSNRLPPTRAQTLCMAGIIPLIFVASTSIGAATGFSYVSGERHFAGLVAIFRFFLFQGEPLCEAAGWAAIVLLVVLVVIYVRSGHKHESKTEADVDSVPLE